MLTDRRPTIDQLSESSGLSQSSVQWVLTEDLGMKRVAAKFIPRALTDTTMHLHTQPSLLHSFFTKNCIVLLPHAPYSPDLALCDFFLFPRMKGHRFDNIEEVKKKTRKELWVISKDDYKNVSNSGSTGGTNVLVVMESILKGIRLFCKKLKTNNL